VCVYVCVRKFVRVLMRVSMFVFAYTTCISVCVCVLVYYIRASIYVLSVRACANVAIAFGKAKTHTRSIPPIRVAVPIVSS